MARKTFGSCCGFDEAGIDAFLYDAEQADKGTDRYPWPAKFKAKVKTAIDGMAFLPAVKEKVNEMVLADLGPGLLGRGPFNLDPRVR